MGTVDVAKGDLPQAPKRAADPLILVRTSLVLKITPIPLITIEERDHLDPIRCMSLAPKANPPGSTAKSDEARFRAHVKAQAESLRSSSDALRELQANMAHLEAQAASNEVRAQGLVSRVAELEAEARERESTVLQANTALADTQRRLEEAQAHITTGTAELVYMQGQLNHMNRFSRRGGYAVGNPIRLLAESHHYTVLTVTPLNQVYDIPFLRIELNSPVSYDFGPDIPFPHS
ncbi:hypothetical protein JAAARDRAFT_191895 [Jaapia argillacea MUCL 33604]|uniref:Uncharacterized protein n=1 Tax=Jaapia argillacea MUCL 33604 TaxID=933084 RepID=A0A067QD50_9AGAM|nr:hypothetical protein JAAARDRAFT_191895 [Jaapia argillacea MUCL 33604]